MLIYAMKLQSFQVYYLSFENCIHLHNYYHSQDRRFMPPKNSPHYHYYHFVVPSAASLASGRLLSITVDQVCVFQNFIQVRRVQHAYTACILTVIGLFCPACFWDSFLLYQLFVLFHCLVLFHFKSIQQFCLSIFLLIFGLFPVFGYW